MKKEYIQPASLAIQLAAESAILADSRTIGIEGNTSGTSSDGINNVEDVLTNREKPGAGLWGK